tara:strand:- start:142 stop:336 length:195 start_codon:yes stop_codon:yes gene_type:complete
MEIELTEQQLDLIRERLSENIKEDSELRIQQQEGTFKGTGWVFVGLEDEKYDLEKILKTKRIEI